ncbi:thioredoxin [Starmerella bacillaris]|uniref:Thioredoxin n=1 Tax=Starmerella bacillaris TaxID=1247836 RepID=A0AAV5RMB9_STABA|nr:thioredoxin [Starmerella bacillaris]
MVSAITSNEQFTDAISNGTTLVDFFAEWCGPCKMISPVLDKLEPQYESIKFVKVDIDNLSDIAKKYEITAVPSFVFFKDGEVVDVVRGAAAAQVKQALDKLKA